MNNTGCSYRLSNGVEIPGIGYGTFKSADGSETTQAVLDAIAAGYRLIDTAKNYGNEESVGEAVRRSPVPRNELFITSKVWNSDQGYSSTLSAFEASLKRLGLEYLDLYLIHWPIPVGHKTDWQELNLQTWRAMERLYREGRVKAIGVCNFLEHHLNPLMAEAAIKPMVDQLEIHPQYPQRQIVAFCKANNICVESWGPLIQGKAFQNEILLETAQKYKKSVAQICIRWALQYGIIPLPKSVHEKRIRENLDVFDFEIKEEDIELINTLNEIGSVSYHPDNFPVE